MYDSKFGNAFLKYILISRHFEAALMEFIYIIPYTINYHGSLLNSHVETERRKPRKGQITYSWKHTLCEGQRWNLQLDF